MLNTTKDSFKLQPLRDFYQSGETRTYAFRKKQLEKLKQAVLDHEDEINKALYTDLKKNQEEAWATETGLLLMEINIMLKNLKKWMSPKSVSTNLLNLPSTSKLHKDPLGVVLIISPWNYPLMLALSPLAGAIAGGNCAVIKPSEMATATSALINRIISKTFDPGFVKVLEGDGAQLVPAMMDEFRFDHIFYTGSLNVGRSIYRHAAEQLIPVTLELGGKSPAIVEKDADIQVAARRITVGKFLNAGQTCIAPDYVLVHESIQSALIAELKKSIESFYADSKEYEFGKIINEIRFNKLLSYLDEGSVIHGGESDLESLYIAPTLLTNLKSDASIMNEEIFGPILPIITFSSFDDALKIVQQNANPLSFYLFTQNKSIEDAWISNVAFGGGCINNAAWHFANPNLPFGGVGNSGMGSYHGRFSFNLFTRLKPVMKSPNWFDPNLKFPPLKGKIKLFKKLIR